MKKKFLLKFGVIASVLAPFLAVVSCEKKTVDNSNNNGDNSNNGGDKSSDEQTLKNLSEALKKIDFTGRTKDYYDSLVFKREDLSKVARDRLEVVIPSDVQSLIDTSGLTIYATKRPNSNVVTFFYLEGEEEKTLADVEVKTFLPTEADTVMTLLESSGETAKSETKWKEALTKATGDYGQLLNSRGQISYIGVANRREINEALAKVKNKATVWVSKKKGSYNLTYTLEYSLDASETKKVIPHTKVEFLGFCPDAHLDDAIKNLSYIFRTKLSKTDFTALTLDKDLNHATTDEMDGDIGYNGDGLIVLYEDSKKGIISDVPLSGGVLGTNGTVHVKKEAGTTWVTWTIKYDDGQSQSPSYDYATEITEFDYQKQLNNND